MVGQRGIYLELWNSVVLEGLPEYTLLLFAWNGDQRGAGLVLLRPAVGFEPRLVSVSRGGRHAQGQETESQVI